jgi:hypothetical protein
MNRPYDICELPFTFFGALTLISNHRSANWQPRHGLGGVGIYRW